MSKDETLKIIKILELNYEEFSEQLKNKQNLKIIVDIWNESLKNTKYTICLKAIKKIIITNNKRPTIYEIKKNILEIEKEKNDEIAWNKAYKVISRGIYMTTNEFEDLDFELKKFFKNLENLKKISKTNISIVNTKVKNKFLKYYKTSKNKSTKNQN